MYVMHMLISFSQHARERMSERGISEEWVRDQLSRCRIFVVTVRDAQEGVITALVEDQERVWAIVLNEVELRVVTVRRAKRSERSLYEQESRQSGE